MAQILFLTQVLPYPLDAGPKIRAYYVLRNLAKQHQVHLVSFVRGEDRDEHAAHLASFCRAVHTIPMIRSRWRDARAVAKAALDGLPVIIARDEIGEMRAMVQAVMAENPIDVIHADQTSMAQYGQHAFSCALANGQSPATVLDAHNALFRVFRQLLDEERNPIKRLLWRSEADALERYEQRVYASFDRVVYVSDQDRQSLGRAVEPHRATTIPICIDPSERSLVDLEDEARTVTHLGTMFWPPNVDGVLWFAREVWPLVREQAPEARFVIVGKRPPLSVRALSAEYPGIDVLGYVADPEPILRQTAAFVVPLRAGAGMRVKILDAWCWGVPIVSTTLGAESIEVRAGKDILIADRPRDMTDAVLHLLSDASLRNRLRESGRLAVRQRYDWRQVYRQWDDVYDKLLENHR